MYTNDNADDDSDDNDGVAGDSGYTFMSLPHCRLDELSCTRYCLPRQVKSQESRRAPQPRGCRSFGVLQISLTRNARHYWWVAVLMSRVGKSSGNTMSIQRDA